MVGDAYGREVDVHVVTTTTVHGPPASGDMYPAASLTGTGTIDGRSVSYLTPAELVRFHAGYPADANDWARRYPRDSMSRYRAGT